MSNKTLNYVWEHSEQRGSTLVLMLAIADLANDDGECWPGNANLASKCRCTVRNLQKLVDKCETDGELLVIENGGTKTKNGWTNRYIIAGMSKRTAKDMNARTPLSKRDVNSDTPEIEGGVNSDVSRDVRPDVSRDVKGDIESLIDPSVDPLKELKEKDSAAPGSAGDDLSDNFKDHDTVEPVPSEILDIAASASVKETAEPAIELVAAPVEVVASPAPVNIPAPAAPTKPARPVNPMYDAIFKVWKLAAGMNGDMEKMLLGTATKKGYKEYNLEEPITPEELLDWAAWWRHTELKGDQTMNMLGVREKIQSSITYWQAIGKPKAPTVPVKPEHRLFKAGDQVPASRPSVNDIQDPRVRDLIKQIAAAKRMPDLQFDAQGNVLQ